MKRYILLLIISAIAATLYAVVPPMEYEVDLTANVSSGDMAPYMIGSWNYGKHNMGKGIWQGGRIEKKMTNDKRFNWGAGIEYALSYTNSSSYDNYTVSDKSWSNKDYRPSPARLQQLYAEIKYRGVYLTVGMKNHHSHTVDEDLSSGDITRSNNARSIPGVQAGFVDFQNIPFTNGWVQINGEIMYGRFFDVDYRKQTFNYYTGVFSYNNWYTYKYCFFRTKPSMPFSVTVGMQTAGEFAGCAYHYKKGNITYFEERGFHFRDIFDMFIPREGVSEAYYKGNSLGSWDLKARYRFANNSTLRAYFQWPWEDGSGIGKATGWDGLWGVQYDFAKQGIVSKVLLEYFDFTNMSGPIHLSPNDSSHPIKDTAITGGDNYYNNEFHGPYCNYGMGLGSPMVVSPIYNFDGYPEYAHNRTRGFHAALQGIITQNIAYKAMYAYQCAGGSGRIPGRELLSNNSAKIQAIWSGAHKLTGLKVKAELAFDAGELRGNNIGALVSLSYTGSLFNKK